MTQVITSLNEWQSSRKMFLSKQSVGFVPTMGNLHQGHQSLLEQSLSQNAITVLSVFVNPTQFNDPSDLEKYPRTLQADIVLATKMGVDYIFCPDYAALYPDDYRYQVREEDISSILEGASRPGHFTGMLTIVLKLLNLVKPTRAYFGEKDFQQLALVKGMVDALFLDTEIVPCAIVREPSGLAMSSRNNRLNAQERSAADAFAKSLQSFTTIEALQEQLAQHNVHVDYIEKWQNRLLAAVQIGKIRLIDNIKIS